MAIISFNTPSFDFLRRYPETLIALSVFILLTIWRRRSSGAGLPVNWPLVGMLPYLFIKSGELHDWSTGVLRRSGCTFVFKGPPFAVDILLTCDPANINHVFNTSFGNYPKGSDFAEIFDILGGGIFNSDDASWIFQRKMAHSLLRHPRFRELNSRVARDKLAGGLFPVLDSFAASGVVVDMQDIFMRLTFDTTCMLIFGVDPGCLSLGLPGVPFARALDDAEEAIFFRHTRPRACTRLLKLLNLGEERRLSSAWRVIDHFIAQYVSAARKKAQLCGGDADLLSSYIAREEQISGAGYDYDKFLRDTTLNLMLAGRDTMSSALTWFLLMVSTNPRVEEKLLEAIRGSPAGSTEGMVYLHAALCESLRLYPPVPFEHKGAVAAERLPSGEEVGGDRRVAVSMYSMARMEGIWGEDCEEFRPERWISPETGKVVREPSWKYPVFNSGPRTCLGKEVALEQLKAVAAAVVERYRMEVVEGHKVRPKLSIILYMEGGLKVRVYRRDEERS